MSYGLNLKQDGALDLVSLGALVHRLDPGIVPFRKATAVSKSTSVAANTTWPPTWPTASACAPASSSAMVDYPIGDLIAGQVRAMGVIPFYKRFPHNGVNGPNMATVYSDRGHGVRRAGGVLQPRQRGRGAAQARRLRLGRDLRRAACAGSTAAASSPRSRRPPAR